VLDFIFLGGDSWRWKAKSVILQRDLNDNNDDVLSDNDQTSDHRPVRATITIE
jgi:endonuclease/exonuclease/phosphatase family metal-dependent hydrolase